MELTTVWFILIAVLWIGYFILDGFDLGVGVLLPFLGKDDLRRRVMINTIGPVWDGNEVWLLTAGGATFAAFPLWYATMFSGFYLALFLVLFGLILRGVAFEYRGKRDSATWRKRWDAAIFIGSVLPALLFGVAFGNVVSGTPIEPLATSGQPDLAGQLNYTGNLFTLLNPFSLLMGLMTLTVFTAHGAIYLRLKTSGEMRDAAKGAALKMGLVAAVIAVASLLWYQAYSERVAVTLPLALVTAVAWLLALFMVVKGRDGWAFIFSSGTILLAVTTLFVGLFPNVMVSSTDAAYNLTVTNASSQSYTLTVMTIVAVIFTPIVLIYQGWTFWVFRKRISTSMIPPQPEVGRADDRFAGAAS
ncbi:MAG: cytochrome d ubiquinol oxidase subunit II [Actinomycetales bacterium]|nr:cytochrome d ubiquinol oxidase subunit II [Actinomycetales bacterium]